MRMPAYRDPRFIGQILQHLHDIWPVEHAFAIRNHPVFNSLQRTEIMDMGIAYIISTKDHIHK